MTAYMNKPQADVFQPGLKDKVAIVTGAGRGIGTAVALAFARHGARLVLVARTTSELEKVAAQVKDLGSVGLVARADISRLQDVDQIVRLALGQYGCVDVLVNAAAVHGPIGRLWEADTEGWVQAVQINLLGTFFTCRQVIPHMIAKGAGKIINFSGGGATSPSPRLSAYGASKAAIVRLTETLAAELADFNIQVNALAPGLVDTSIHDDILAAGQNAGDLLHDVRRLRESGTGAVPAELAAELAVFLASSRSAGLTGKLIAAPYDGWQEWNQQRIAELMNTPWFTLRRMDDFTLNPFLVPRTSVAS
jgi:NAD(P)-dependent dehydrogenase (short-subunit alcohol dehydrogenase family)